MFYNKLHEQSPDVESSSHGRFTVVSSKHLAIAGPTFPEASALILDAAPKAGIVYLDRSVMTE